MFGAYGFAQGYFGQGPLGGTPPILFLLNICDTDVRSLMPERLTVSLAPERDTALLDVHIRRNTKICP